ncbi:hypothetical protein GCM10027063_16490 [Promicromonospora xylanilytica]
MDMPKLLEQAWARRLNEEFKLRGWMMVAMEDVVIYEKVAGESRRRVVADVLRQSKRPIVLPKIGIRFPMISEAVGRLTGDSRASTATVGIDLIHLVRREEDHAGASRWMVSGADHVDQVIEQLFDDLERSGELFFREFSSVDLLLENYRNYLLAPPQRLDVAVAFLERGRAVEASEILDPLASDGSIVDPKIRRAIEKAGARLHGGRT